MSIRSEHPDLLLEHGAGSLEPQQAAEVAAHLKKCSDCRLEAEALASMKKSLLRENRADHVPGEELVAYEEGALARDPVRSSRIERHLHGCEECRLDLRTLERARRVQESSEPIARADAPARRSWRIWALAAAAVAAILAIPIVPGLFTRPDPGPGPARPRTVTFAPPRRGGAEERLLPAGAPCSLKVVLPFGAPEGTYRLHIEREDGSRVSGTEASIPTDGGLSLTVAMTAPSAEGSYRLLLAPREPADGAPYVYPFKVVPPGARTPGDHEP